MGSSENVVNEYAELQRALGRVEAKVDRLLEDRRELRDEVEELKIESAGSKAVAKKFAVATGAVVSVVTSAAAALVVKYFGGP